MAKGFVGLLNRTTRSVAVRIISLLFVVSAGFANSGITYHGRLLRPDNTPVNSATTQFRIQIRTPGTENCLLWEEQQTKDLSNTNGVFSLTIADTSEPSLIANTLPYTLDRVFSNRTNFSALTGCSVGSTYNPTGSDGRNLQVQFRESSSDPWELMPATKINFVPLTLNSMQLEGYQASEFLKIDSASSYTPLTATQVNTLMDIIAGTDTQYLRPSTTFSGDVSGTYNTTSVDKIKGVSVSSTAPTNGQILKLVGGVWTPAAETGTATDASYSAKGLVQVNTDQATSGLYIASGVLAMPNVITAGGPTGGAQTIPVITYDQKGRLTAVSTATVDDTTKLPLAGGTMTGSINMGTQNITNATSVATTNVSTRNVILADNDTNTITVRAPADVTASYNFTLPATGGTAGHVLSTDGSGTLSWIAPATGGLSTADYNADVAPAASCTTSQTPYWNTVADTWACQNIKVTGAGAFFVDGGNSLGAAATLGTNDNQPLDLETNGTTRIRVLASGNVGIGTSTPVEKLDVSGGVRVGNTTGSNAGTIRWDGTSFQGYTGTSWVNLSGSAAPGTTACDTTQTFATFGTYTYNVPASFGTITIKIWGGGGGGGAGYAGGPAGGGTNGATSSINSLGLFAAGGSGGGFASVSSGITTGAGGAGGTASGGSVNQNGSSGAAGGSGTGGAGGSAPNGGAGGISWNNGGSPGGGGGGTASGSYYGGGGGSGSYVEKTYTSATLIPGTNINDIVVGGGGAGGYSAGGTGGAGGSGRVTIACSSTGTPPANDRALLFVDGGSYSNSTNLVYTSSGNLGVGTGSPNTTLDINGALSQRGAAAPAVSPAGQGRIYFDSTSNKFRVSENGGAYADLIGSSGAGAFVDGGNTFTSAATLGSNSNHALNFETNGSNRMTILADGKVGIGTATPTGIFEVDGGTAANGVAGNSIKLTAQNGNASDSGSVIIKGGTFGPGTGASMTLEGSNSMYWGGNVNITAGNADNNMAPGSVTIMSGSAANSGGGTVTLTTGQGNNGKSGPVFIHSGTAGFQGTGDVHLGVTSSGTVQGQVAIGALTPTSTLDINGAITQRGMPAPAVSPAGQGRIYFDSTSNTFKASQNGGGYSDLVTTSNTSFLTTSAYSADITPAASCTTTQTPYWNTVADTWSCQTINFAAGGGFVDGGNSLGAAATLGTNDNYALNIETNGSNRMTILSGGNVGVGTTTPAARLDVSGNISAAASTTGKNLHLSTFTLTDNVTATSGTAASNQINVIEAPTLAATNTGVVTTESSTLQISGAPIKGTNNTITNAVALDIAAGAVGAHTRAYGLRVAAPTGAGSNYSAIFTGGYVGIGTSTPSAPLSVMGDILIDGGNVNKVATINVEQSTSSITIQQNNNGNTANLVMRVGSHASFNFNGSERFRVTSDGKVGIGVVPTTEVLEVNGNVKATSFISTSDARLKTNVRPISGLESILKLQGVQYNWIDTGEADAGLLAQEVEKVFPDAVRTNVKTGNKGVKYQYLIAPLIESSKQLYGLCKMQDSQLKQIQRSIASLQEKDQKQTHDIEALKTENKILKNENEKLKKRLEKIEKALGL